MANSDDEGRLREQDHRNRRSKQIPGYSDTDHKLKTMDRNRIEVTVVLPNDPAPSNCCPPLFRCLTGFSWPQVSLGHRSLFLWLLPVWFFCFVKLKARFQCSLVSSGRHLDGAGLPPDRLGKVATFGMGRGQCVQQAVIVPAC